MPEPQIQTPVVVCDYRPRQAHVGEAEDEAEFKPSKIGEPYNHPLPKSKGDPWTTLLRPLQEKDAGRCKAWREEVENLLIFAGLFSAVVTALIVESYKMLQPDLNDQSVVLLSRILSQLEGGMAVNTSTTTTPPSFSATPTSIRINIMWFLSLVLSLATVLVGIVSLQWLREHQRPRPDLPPQLAYSLFHMHTESIERWYLPQIFTMLPLLLQSGLILFLVGIIEFLWQLNRSAAIPVIFVIGLVLCFLALTTTLPCLQALSLFLPRLPWNKAPRVQCAYMSPQSWAFHRFIAPVINVIMRLFSVDVDMWREFTADTVVANDRPYDKIPSATAIIFRLANEDSWLDHGIGWLYQRDVDFISLVPTLKSQLSQYSRCVPPTFDANQALSTAVDGASQKTDDEIFAVENCIQEMSEFAKSLEEYSPKWYFEYLQRLYGWEPPSPQSNNLAVQQDNFLFTCGHLHFRRISVPSLRRHKLELLSRLLEWGSMPTEQEVMSLSGVIYVVLDHNIHHGPDFAGLGIEKPLQGIVEKFFKNPDVFDPRNDSVSQRLQTPGRLRVFLVEIGILLVRVFPDTVVLDQDSLFKSITSRLRSALDLDQPPIQPDFIFYNAVIYLTTILNPVIRPDMMVTLTDNFRILTATLLEYHERMGRTPELETLLQFDHDYHWLGYGGFVEGAKRHGIVYPQPASRTMTPDTEIPLPALLTADAVKAEPVDQTQTLATASPTSPFAEDDESDLPSGLPDKFQPASAPTTGAANLNSQTLPPTDGIDDGAHTNQTPRTNDNIADFAHSRAIIDDSISQDAAERTPGTMHVHIDMDEQ